MIRKLVVGLGNPGDSYQNNRHNLGFKAIDYIAEKLEVLLDFDRRKSVYGKVVVDDDREMIIFKPQTFSNLSGEAVLYIASFLKIATKDILVIFEDSLLDFGSTKINALKSAVVHRGVQSLSEQLNSQEYATLSVGVGPLPLKVSDEEFCMQDFSPEELLALPDLLEEVRKICWQFVAD